MTKCYDPQSIDRVRQNATFIVSRVMSSRATWTTLYVLTFTTAAVTA